MSRDSAPPPATYVAASGGIFRDMTIHDFDMARSMLGDIVGVSAVGANSFSAEMAEAGDFDSAVVTPRAANGAVATIINSRHSAFGYDQRIETFGSDGMLQATNVPSSSVLVSGASGSPDFEDGRAALILADAAQLSATTGRPVAV